MECRSNKIKIGVKSSCKNEQPRHQQRKQKIIVSLTITETPKKGQQEDFKPSDNKISQKEYQ
jgi:hypothetical protein